MPEPEVDVTVNPTPPAQDDKDWKAEFERTLSESRKWESRAKENNRAAEKLAEIEEAKKTAEQKLEERASKAESDLSVTQLRAARAEVALEQGLTASQAKRLVGSTKEELEADAAELLKDLGKPVTTVPKPDPSQGTKDKPAGGSVQAGRDLFDNSRKKSTS